MDVSSTILAVASPPGRSVRGMIRISGPQAFELLSENSIALGRGFTTDAGPEAATGVGDDDPDRASSRSRAGFRACPRGPHIAHIRVLQHPLPALAIIAPTPRSYTGEDCIELQLPGNPDLLERVIDSILRGAEQRAIRARRAHPGEFTARAFLNGKMSLTQAEGVAATIAARSDAELRAAASLRSGSLGLIANVLADELASTLALVEAGIDFTDQEDVIAIAPADLHARLISLRQRISTHLNRAVGSEQLAAIPWVVLRGRPNAGKSTLFNALLGRHRAVVSDLAGTTRDVLAEPLAIPTEHGPAEVMLVDLAGLDDAGGSLINQAMQAAARSAIARAELIIDCVPADDLSPPTHDARTIRTICIRTKGDLSGAAGGSEPAAHCLVNEPITVSARTGEGLDDLRREIAEQLADRAVCLASDAMALQPRHETALRSALVNVEAAIELVAPQRSGGQLRYSELVASSMREALNDLGALAGDITPDDVLGRIFSSFCVGK